jgi:hypothetical protein
MNLYDDLKDIINTLPNDQKKSILNTFGEPSIKGSIYHELSH